MAKTTKSVDPIEALRAKRSEFIALNATITAEIIDLEQAGAVRARVDETDDKIESAARALFNGTGHLLEPRRKSRSVQDRLADLWEKKAAVNRAEELAAKRLDALLAEQADKRAVKEMPEWRSLQKQRALAVAVLIRLNRESAAMHQRIGQSARLPLTGREGRLLGCGADAPGPTGIFAQKFLDDALAEGIVTQKEISNA